MSIVSRLQCYSVTEDRKLPFLIYIIFTEPTIFIELNKFISRTLTTATQMNKNATEKVTSRHLNRFRDYSNSSSYVKVGKKISWSCREGTASELIHSKVHRLTVHVLERT